MVWSSFSAICDIGSASFKYDMRRLPEILALPKAWYRRTLARRMFLGEETVMLESDSGWGNITEKLSLGYITGSQLMKGCEVFHRLVRLPKQLLSFEQALLLSV